MLSQITSNPIKKIYGYFLCFNNLAMRSEITSTLFEHNKAISQTW